MARLTEIALFLAPFLVFAVWWRLGSSGRRLAWVALGCLVVLLASLTWLALSSGFPRSGGYVPAHLEGGRVVPGHGA